MKLLNKTDNSAEIELSQYTISRLDQPKKITTYSDHTGRCVYSATATNTSSMIFFGVQFLFVHHFSLKILTVHRRPSATTTEVESAFQEPLTNFWADFATGDFNFNQNSNRCKLKNVWPNLVSSGTFLHYEPLHKKRVRLHESALCQCWFIGKTFQLPLSNLSLFVCDRRSWYFRIAADIHQKTPKNLGSFVASLVSDVFQQTQQTFQIPPSMCRRTFRISSLVCYF